MHPSAPDGDSDPTRRRSCCNQTRYNRSRRGSSSCEGTGLIGGIQRQRCGFSRLPNPDRTRCICSDPELSRPQSARAREREGDRVFVDAGRGSAARGSWCTTGMVRIRSYRSEAGRPDHPTGLRGTNLGAFANAIGLIVRPHAPASSKTPDEMRDRNRGLGGWLFDRLRRRSLTVPRLSVVERITLAPRQTLALIEADGQRLLVATSPDGAPAFYPLNGPSSRRPARSAKAAPEGKTVL